MKILHSGESHYDPGEEVAHAHGHHHGHSHGHSQEHAKRKIKDNEVKKSLIENEEGHQAEHVHNHGHDHQHHHHHEHSHSHAPVVDNSRDAGFRAVVANVLLSLGLIAVSTSIYFFPWMVLGDLIYVLVFALVILCMTIPVTKDVITVMMEGAPKHLNVEHMREDIYRECGDDI